MRTPKEWLSGMFPREVTPEYIAAIQADARTGMVPVEKVKELAQALQMWTDNYMNGVESLAEKELNRIRATNKALAAAKEIGLL